MSLEVALHSRRKTGSPGSNSAGRTRYLAAVVTEHTWPPANLEWRKLWLDAHTGVLQDAVPLKTFQESFKTRRGSLSFVWIAPEDLDIIGPMALTLAVEVAGANDVFLFVNVRKFRAGTEQVFEGSYGFAGDSVSKGWQRRPLGTRPDIIYTRTTCAPAPARRRTPAGRESDSPRGTAGACNPF